MLNILFIATGGFLGAIARSSLAQLVVNQTDIVIPVATLTVNLLGSFGLALALSLFAQGLNLSSQVQLGIGTGFFGSFTTFSTISLEAVYLLDNYHPFWWLAYDFMNIAGGLAAAYLGYYVAKKTGLTLKDKAGSQ